jgi:hypothetical protein
VVDNLCVCLKGIISEGDDDGKEREKLMERRVRETEGEGCSGVEVILEGMLLICEHKQ